MPEIIGSNLVTYIFVIFTGASILATLALYTKQSLLVAYILLGFLLGPNGFSIVTDSNIIDEISRIGIIFLLFLLGLNLHPQNLLRMLQDTIVVTVISFIIFASIGFIVAYIFGFSLLESSIIAVAMTFSSTIVGLKLLPTTVLHHQKVGEVIISVLLLQDIIAIALMLIINLYGNTGYDILAGGEYLNSVLVIIVKFLLGLPGLIAIIFLAQYFIINKLFRRFDKIKEYIFLLSIGWCLGVAELSYLFGFSHEIGAFFAGIALAANNISLYIAESLKPLRDFFLVLFFFALGAQFDLDSFYNVIAPAILLVLIMTTVKPVVFDKLLLFNKNFDKRPDLTREIGVRLGQLSEFSLLFIYFAAEGLNISKNAVSLVQSVTILSFVISSYLIIMNYPTPMATSDRLRQD